MVLSVQVNDREGETYYYIIVLNYTYPTHVSHFYVTITITITYTYIEYIFKWYLLILQQDYETFQNISIQTLLHS